MKAYGICMTSDLTRRIQTVLAKTTPPASDAPRFRTKPNRPLRDERRDEIPQGMRTSSWKTWEMGL